MMLARSWGDRTLKMFLVAGGKNTCQDRGHKGRIGSSLDEPKVLEFIAYLYLLPEFISCLCNIKSRQNGCKG